MEDLPGHLEQQHEEVDRAGLHSKTCTAIGASSASGRALGYLGLGGHVQNTGLDWGLAGKPVIVTGASSGIGAATVRALGAAGASVLLVGRDEGRLNQQVAKVAAAGGRGVAAMVDLEDAEATAGLVDRAVEEFGSLHGMVLAASLFDPRPLEDTSLGCLDTQWTTTCLRR